MNSMFQWIYKKITVSIIGQEAIESDGTDIKVASSNQTNSSGSSLTLATISVAPGFYCIIGDVDYFTTSSTGGTLSLSYTDPISTSAVTRYVSLAAAGWNGDDHNFRDHPFLAVYNPSSASGSVSITIATTTTTTSSQYITNVAYVLREPKL